jgi:thioredoxin 1
MTLPEVTDATFDAEVLESADPVLVDFTAAWCPPCRVMKPVLAELADEVPNLRVVQVDTDVHKDSAIRYEVLAMPTFVLFRAGTPVLRLVGARPKSRLRAEVESALS